jgi:hypothetical protein
VPRSTAESVQTRPARRPARCPRPPSGSGSAHPRECTPRRRSFVYWIPSCLRSRPLRKALAASLTHTPKQHFCCIETSPPCVLPPPQAVRRSQPLSPARPSSTFAALEHSPRAFFLRRRRCGNHSPLTHTQTLKHSPVRSPSAAGGAGITALSPIRPNAAFVALKRATNTEICPNQNIYHLFAQFHSCHTVYSHKQNA